MTRTFLIDTDTASDDAVALIMALRAPGVRVAAITTVAGSVGVEQATRNALFVIELCGADVPVYIGAEKPLVKRRQSIEPFHGHDGLSDLGYTPRCRSPETLSAVDAIINVITESPGIEIVALGPLTNISLALSREPSIINKIGRCVIMGGAPCYDGNITPVAEFNFWMDPHAARKVLESALPLELVGVHLCRGGAILTGAEIEKIRELPGELGKFAIDCNSSIRQAYGKKTGTDGLALPDPVAMSIALDTMIGVRWSEHYVNVETESELTCGMSVVDRNNIAGNQCNRAAWRNVLDSGSKTKVYWQIATERWKAALINALSAPLPLIKSLG